jgi:hypothetical protein
MDHDDLGYLLVQDQVLDPVLEIAVALHSPACLIVVEAVKKVHNRISTSRILAKGRREKDAVGLLAGQHLRGHRLEFDDRAARKFYRRQVAPPAFPFELAEGPVRIPDSPRKQGKACEEQSDCTS